MSDLIGLPLLFVGVIAAILRERVASRLQGRIFGTLSWLLGVASTLLLIGYGRVDFNKYLNMAGDTMQVNVFAKSYIDGFGFRFNPNLGFPGHLDNLYWPTFDFCYRIILFICSIFTNNFIISYHLLYLLCIIFMFTFSMISMRKIGIALWLSVPASAIFVVSPYFASRCLVHDFLSLYMSVPLGAVLALLVGTMPIDQTARRFFRDPFVWLAVAIVATSGLYYAFFTCMFTAVTGIAVALGQRRQTAVVVALLLVAIIFPLMVLTGYGSGIIDVLSGAIHQPIRGRQEELGLGLNMAEAVMPLSQIPGLGWTLPLYLSVPEMPGTGNLFEFPGVVLTFIILASPFIVLQAGLNKSVSTDTRQRLIYLSAGLIVFGLLYAIRGGLAFYFNLLVVPDIRAPARIIPFLSFFSLVILLTAVQYAGKSSWISVRIALPGLIFVGLILSMLPSVGSLGNKQALVHSNTARTSDLDGVKQMLLAKDTNDLKAVLQLPIFPWPEHPDQNGYNPYDDELPYVFDRPHSPTRWSYGASFSQPAYQKNKELFEAHKTAGLAEAVVDSGFDAILIEKSAYDKDELTAITGNIENDLKSGCKVFDDQFRVLYSLKSPNERSLCIQPPG
jgi:phosphoglycerol transferase